MLEVRSKDNSKCMYTALEKLKLSSTYGMCVAELSDSDKEKIKQAYKSGYTHVYFDTDSAK